MSARLILDVYDAKRRRHPELRRPLTWESLCTVLMRERVPLLYRPLSRPAMLLSALGTSVIVVNSDLPPRRHTYFVAHELAHAWLHVDGRESVVYHMDVDWRDDEREGEAEALASLLLGGPAYRRFLDV